MAEYLKLKKSNCKNCYKCIRRCAVKSIRFSGGQAHIVESECILCGQCFVNCPQDAKEIVSSREAVEVILNEGVPVIVSLAPAFIANYDGASIQSMRNALKQLGFTDVEETAMGATIVKDEYQRVIDEESPEILISSACHSVNLLIQKHYPNALKYLAQVVSPMQAHGLDIKKRYPDAKVIFIGPCVAKKDEAGYYKGIIDEVLTFEELSEWLCDRNIKIEIETEIEKIEESRARFFPVSGGILKTIRNKNPEYTYLYVDGVENCMKALEEIEKGELRKCFVEMSSCVGSCIGGPVMEKHRGKPLGDYMRIKNAAGEKDFQVEPLERMQMNKPFLPIPPKNMDPSPKEILDILKEFGRENEENQLNCGSCGYHSCREKAIAVYHGKAEITMCLPFLSEKAETFSDIIVNNTPNAIIVLNDSFEVQRLNGAAVDLLHLRSASDVLGEQVIRILDPTDFMEVKRTGFAIRDKSVYLAEYNKHVQETILFDKQYKMFICILRDITSAEIARVKKEEIGRETIETTDRVIQKQMRVVHEIASLLGETAAETKIALTKLKESIGDD